MTNINDILETIQNFCDKDNLQLSFIIRNLKPNIKKSSKVIDKYNFYAYHTTIDDSIRDFLFELVQEQLSRSLNKNFNLNEYDVISDDTEQLFTYSMKNKGLSFASVMEQLINPNAPKIQSIEQLKKEGEIWAYSIGLYNSNDRNYIFSFRKILPNKVAIDEKGSPNKPKLSFLRTHFNNKSQKLEILEGETISLDKQIDCIFFNEIFYIFKKNYFEQIVGLGEEYKKKALNIADTLKTNEHIEGLDILDKMIEDKPSIHKKLIKIKEQYKNMTSNDMKKLITVSKKYKLNLKMSNNKLIISNEKDAENLIKVLADYFKIGDMSGIAYGTYAGKQIKTEL